MIEAGYFILIASLVISGGALILDRDRCIVYASAFFVCYEVMERALVALDRFDMLAYAPLAVAIDTAFFYLFKHNKYRLSALACGFSALYGGATLYGIYADSLFFYSSYENVAIAVSLLILIDGASRAWRYKHIPTPGGHDMLDRLAFRLKAIFAGKA